MKKNLGNKKWFTLVEILVALTIFSVMMISVMSIYITSSSTTYNSEVNVAIHENVKNVVLDISENIVNDWIMWVLDDISSSCSDKSESKQDVYKWTIFCSKSGDKYFLVSKKADWSFKKIDNTSIASDCDKIDSECFLAKNDENNWLLTNNLVTIRKLNFLYTNFWTKKITLSMEIQPSIKSWFRPSIAEKSVFNLQTTLNQRFSGK